MKRLAKYLPEELPYEKIIEKVKLVDCIKMFPEFKELLLKENSDIYTKSYFKKAMDGNFQMLKYLKIQ